MSSLTSMRLTIIVCTYNRAISLKQTLECLSQQTISESMPWELIVVDNNSTDETKNVVSGMRSRIPDLRYEFESRQGLSHARNRGVSAARGDYIFFTDDDVCPEKIWAARLYEHMRTTGCSGAGGFVAPKWETQPPPWLTERFYGYLAVHSSERNRETEVLDVHDAPYGANIGFRREVFDKIGLFDPALGRKGTVLAAGEEWDLIARMLNVGMKVMFFPDARVAHRIESARMTRRYFRRWRYEASRAETEKYGVPGRRRVLGIPWYMFPQLVRALSKATIAQLTLPSDEALQKEILCWHFLGTMAALYNRDKTLG
jgi:glycosyltransferase involved in cell wall biosynthesis